MSARNILCCFFLCISSAWKPAFGQGFVNLDFENGAFVPVPGQFNTVEFAPALSGWTGYIGTNQINWALHNSLFLSTAGIALWGPDNPSPDFFHGQYYIVLQNPLGVPTDVPAIAQTGMIPATAQSIRFLNNNPFTTGFTVLFEGESIPVQFLGEASNGRPIWGGDISALASQTGELRLRGVGYLDFIQFSNQPIPEPSTFGLFGVGALLFGWRFLRSSRAKEKSGRSRSLRRLAKSLS